MRRRHRPERRGHFGISDFLLGSIATLTGVIVLAAAAATLLPDMFSLSDVRIETKAAEVTVAETLPEDEDDGDVAELTESEHDMRDLIEEASREAQEEASRHAEEDLTAAETDTAAADHGQAPTSETEDGYLVHPDQSGRTEESIEGPAAETTEAAPYSYSETEDAQGPGVN